MNGYFPLAKIPAGAESLRILALLLEVQSAQRRLALDIEDALRCARTGIDQSAPVRVDGKL